MDMSNICKYIYIYMYIYIYIYIYIYKYPIACGSPATVPFSCNGHDPSGIRFVVIGVVSVCVCVCVDACVHVCCVWLHFNFILGLLFDHLG